MKRALIKPPEILRVAPKLLPLLKMTQKIGTAIVATKNIQVACSKPRTVGEIQPISSEKIPKKTINIRERNNSSVSVAFGFIFFL